MEDTSKLDPDASESSLSQHEVQISSMDSPDQLDSTIQMSSVDMLPSFEIDWPSPAGNGMSVLAVDKEEHKTLAAQVQKLEMQTAELDIKIRKHKRQRQAASQKTRRKFRVTKRNLRDLSDLLQKMQTWRRVLDNALYPVLEQRLELADEQESENIMDLLEMADEECTKL